MATTPATELHQLKNSLAVIAGWARTLDERWEDLSDDRRREAVRIIRRTSDVLTEQARPLLDASPVDPGRPSAE